jgi:LEA14-like dessication related protein
MKKLIPFFSLILMGLMVGCASLNPAPKDPEVKLMAIRLLPSQSIFQHTLAIDLQIFNPNKKDLNIRQINYAVAIEHVKLLTGVKDQFPSLPAMQDTPVTLEVTADLLQMGKLIEHFIRSGDANTPIEKLNYNFTADIDFSAWLPTLHVNKVGAVPLGGQEALK